jgi:nickel superoxide dismutase
MKFKNFLLLSLLGLFALPKVALTHCEIPCSIYNDEIRFNLLAEHITTIEKSMTQISELSAEGEKNYNQLVRWINNKEEHSSAFVDIVTKYFLTQRIKVIAPGSDGYDNYVMKVTLLHGMIRTAMKCKQTTDLSNTSTLNKLLKDFEELYLSEHKH